MSGTLDSLVESGGSPLVPVSHVSALISAGATGTILSVTAGAGQYIKLNELITYDTGQAGGLTFTVNGVALFTNGSLIDYTPSNQSLASSDFGVSRSYASSAILYGFNILPSIFCTSFSLTQLSGSTSRDIRYAYEILEKI
tara:strand:+ start:19 stop:441 length:423 start_codon:yes stop_codon:yes gene_type:complete